MKKTLALLKEYNERHNLPFAHIRIYDDETGRVLADTDIDITLFGFTNVKELKEKLKK